MATATTMMVPTANEVEPLSPVRNWPAMATITVKPDTRMARPEVADAIASAVCWSCPLARSSRSRLR